MKKKITLVAILTVVFLNAISQNYIPLLSDSNSWYISSYFESCETKIFWASQDTIISNKHYKILKGENCTYINDTCNIGYLREDTLTRKVYAKLASTLTQNDTAEFVFYDFSLSVNDSIFLYNPKFYSEWFYDGRDTLGWYKIDSIILGNTIAGQRKYFYLHKCSDIYTKMTWVEGVGAINGEYNLTLYWSAYSWLHCKFNENIKQFTSDEFYYLGWDTVCSCSYLNIENSPSEKALNIYPVPALNEIFIESNDNKDKIIEIEIINTLGIIEKRIVPIINTSSKIDISDLNNGIYIIRVVLNDNSYSKKIIKITYR
jgi:hypothetical protein